MTTQSTGDSLRRAVIQQLESLQRAGLTHIPRFEHDLSPAEPAPVETVGQSVPAPVTTPAIAASQSTRAVAPAPAARSLFGDDAPAAPVRAGGRTEPSDMPLEERRRRLEEIARKVADCTRCAELACTRTQTVFGVGSPQARLLFIGEAPGADEDAQGEPFVGRAGQLLNKIVEACGFRREDVYICNILKCRPPGNRTPAPLEADNCREYLLGQLEIVDPDYVVCWGSVAAGNLLGEKLPIGRLRGKFFQYGRAKVLCTYHPSYLLRNPAAKKDVWEDMKFLLKDMGLQPKAR